MERKSLPHFILLDGVIAEAGVLELVVVVGKVDLVGIEAGVILVLGRAFRLRRSIFSETDHIAVSSSLARMRAAACGPELEHGTAHGVVVGGTVGGRAHHRLVLRRQVRRAIEHLGEGFGGGNQE